MSKVCAAGIARRQGQDRHRLCTAWEIQTRNIVCWDSEIMWISKADLDKLCPWKSLQKSRARCNAGLSFDTKQNTVPMYLPASFSAFHSPTQEINLFTLFLCPSPSFFFFISWGLCLNWTWTAESPSAWWWKAEKESRESRERWRRKNSAGGGHRRSFSLWSLFSWHTTALLPQRPCFPSEYSPSLPPL